LSENLVPQSGDWSRLEPSSSWPDSTCRWPRGGGAARCGTRYGAARIGCRQSSADPRRIPQRSCGRRSVGGAGPGMLNRGRINDLRRGKARAWVGHQWRAGGRDMAWKCPGDDSRHESSRRQGVVHATVMPATTRRNAGANVLPVEYARSASAMTIGHASIDDGVSSSGRGRRVTLGREFSPRGDYLECSRLGCVRRVISWLGVVDRCWAGDQYLPG